MQFESFGLAPAIERAVHATGYRQATPIQVQAIPPALEGRDILGCAQTGTGKTAAFALPILHRLAAASGAGRRPIRCLIVTPTRELAAQIDESLRTYGKFLSLRSAVIFGGVNQHSQVQALHRGLDILVATPGRLLDLMKQGHVHLDRVEILVLDEADRMLDMGFINDIRAIVAKVPRKRQTLFFSATMPDAIRELASGLLNDPVFISVTPQASAAVTVAQRVYLVDRENKQELLAHLLGDPVMDKTLVFTRTKHGADRVAKRLGRAGIDALAIHGGKSQNNRTRALRAFTTGATRVLIASDLAARGLDIDDITHVVNFDLPNEPETYVHRIGRTGRAGASGMAISFCAEEERTYLRDIERITRAAIEIEKDHPYRATFHTLPVDDRSGRSAPGKARGPARSGAPRRPRGGRDAGAGEPAQRRPRQGGGQRAADAQAPRRRRGPPGAGTSQKTAEPQPAPRRRRGPPGASSPAQGASDERRSGEPSRRGRGRNTGRS